MREVVCELLLRLAHTVAVAVVGARSTVAGGATVAWGAGALSSFAVARTLAGALDTVGHMVIVAAGRRGPGPTLRTRAQRAVCAGPHSYLNSVIEVRKALASVLKVGGGLASAMTTAPVGAVSIGGTDGTEKQNSDCYGLHSDVIVLV